MNALDVCNACEVNDADPDSPAGYCTECEAEARIESNHSSHCSTKGAPGCDCAKEN